MLDWRPIMAPSSVAAGGGVLASGVSDQFWIMVKWMWWFGMDGLPDGKNPWNSGKNRRKTKNPPAGEAGGVLEKIDDLNQI